MFKTLEKAHRLRPESSIILHNLARALKDAGRYREAEPLYRRSLTIVEKERQHPDVAIPLNGLAALYQAQGRYGEAEPLYERAQAIREKALGPQHPAVATGLNDLAGLYEDQGRYREAEPLYRRALAINEKALGPAAGRGDVRPHGAPEVATEPPLNLGAPLIYHRRHSAAPRGGELQGRSLTFSHVARQGAGARRGL